MLKKIKGWKTFFLGLGTAIFGFIAGYDYTIMTDDPQILGYITGAIGILQIIFRFLTNTSIFKSK